MKKGFTTSILAIAIIAFLLSSCDEKTTTDPGQDCPDYAGAPTLASDWVGYVNWDNATRVSITAEEVGEESMHYTPSSMEFIAGKPYILTMKMKSANTEKHYYYSPDFYKAIATRKIQTTNAEYKAPYFDAVELVLNGECELYFVPVIAGTYPLWCTITGHEEKGMKMTVTIVCGDGLSLDLEVDPNFNTALGSDPRRSGDDPVWDSKQTVVVNMIENSTEPGSEDFAFDPETITLSAGQAYVLKIQNSAGNEFKHYFTAAEFFKTIVTRKAEDSRAEIKVQYFKAVELLIGGYTELFIVPTVTGTYDVLCTIEGHADAGMVGTIIVE